MSKFKIKKVFDCQDMPKEVKTAFLDKFRKGNDVLIEMYVLEEGKPIELVNPDECGYKEHLVLYENTGNEIISEYTISGVRYVKQRGDDIIGDWLFDNGAEVDEEVIVKHWW